MKIAFFHGLESPAVSDKTEYLQENFNNPYCTALDYKNDKTVYDRTLEYVKNNDIDLLVGSSMGGWLAYCISTETGIPTVLFNPAFHSRSFEICKPTGKIGSNHTVILGEFDTLIKPEVTKYIIETYGIGEFFIHDEPIEHRTPIEIFEKYLNKYI